MAKKETRHSELVSESQNIDAPYELPEGWKWCRLGDVCEKIKRGKSPKYTDKSKILVFAQKCNQPDGTMSLEKALFLNEELLSKYKDDDFVKDGDILINSTGTGTIGRVGYFDKALLPEGMKLVPDTHVTTVRACADNASKFFYYFIKQKESYLELKGVGTTNMKELHADVLENLSFPLPPTLAEQQRIVNRIESMFAKLDEAKDKAQSVVDSFENRKAAILHKAFSGELTANWRKENGVSDESWEEKRINDCCIPRAGYAFDSKKFTTSGFQIIRMGNLYAGELDLSRSPVYYSENDLDDSIKKRALINDGDILITLTGTKYKRDYGYAVRIDNPNSLLVNQRILCLTPKNEIKTNYLLYYLHSNMFRDVFFSNETGGVNQGNVSSKFVESISFRLPTLPEQQEIVRILDTVLEKESRAKEAAQTVLDQIALLKKSILARAFRGEL